MDAKPPTENEHNSNFESLIRAAEGFAQLGMYLDANSELEKIAPEARTRSEVLTIRALIYRALEKWELLEVVSRTLALRHPERDNAIIDWALATRKCHSLEAAVLFLRNFVSKCPNRDRVQYELARCECEAGNLSAAKEHLAQVFNRDPGFRLKMIDDSVFSSIWGFES